MLLKITTKCNMECNHCMNSSTVNGQDMSLETLNDVLSFMERTSTGRFLIITGGEPMNHPKFFDIIRIILEDYKNRFRDGSYNIIVTTNGETMMKPENIEKICNLLDIYTNLNIQVINDSRYYPRKVELVEEYIGYDKQILYFDNIGKSLYPIGRAQNLITPEESDKKCTLCTNYRLIYKQSPLKSLMAIELYFAETGNSCSPTIMPNGDILLGESDHCTKCSSIYKNEEEILKDIENFDCRKCSILYNRAISNPQVKKLLES